jgi:hypothetical protein
MNWISVPLDFVPLPGSNDVFVRAATPVDANDLKKTTGARNRARQDHFESELKKLSWHLGSNSVPIFIDFNGDKRRMDKGCIGHAVAAGFLEPPTNGPDGFATTVLLR